MKNRPIHQFFLFVLIIISLYSRVIAGEQNLNDFILQIQDSFAQKDVAAYLKNFSEEIQAVEESSFKDKFDLFQIERATLFKTSEMILSKNEAEIYLQAMFQNSYSVIIETWHLILRRMEDLWQIQKKNIIGNISSLYMIQIPSTRSEKVTSIEIEHEDITLKFKNALLFYDNIPQLETGLIIIGKGEVRFSPSNPVEQHQLNLLYGKDFIKDELTYAYLRFSDQFFRNNIKIVRSPGDRDYQPTSEDRNGARSIFSRHYPRSFTVENSLNKKLLSTLPQGEETIIAFKGIKKGIFTYIYSPFSEEEVNLFRWKDEKIINLYSPDSGEEGKRLFLSFVRMFEVKNYQIDVNFEPEQSFLSGKARIEVEPKVDSLDRLKFKLNSKLRILRIIDEEGRSLFFSQDRLRETLYVYFIRPPAKNRNCFIEIYYRGKIEVPELEADVIAGPQIYKWGGRFGQNIVFLPPEYETYLLSRSAFWYPSPSENDYFQASLRVTVPSPFKCISNGELKDEILKKGDKEVESWDDAKSATFVFETKYPVKYLSFIVGLFTQIGEDTELLPIRHFHSSGISFARSETLQEARNIVRFYEERFGPYPYSQLSVVRRLWITIGGHSPASFIILNELFQAQDGSVLVPGRSPVDLSRWREYFIAHEIAHQWWGQAVTWKTYHDHWLSEGLAQFSAVQYLRQKHGEEVLEPIFSRMSMWTENKAEWGPISLGGRLSLHDPLAYQAIIYNKTTLVLDMLKDLLGEELFYQGMKEFFNEHKYSAATTKNFSETMEEISGKDLEGFFEKWFDSTSLPDVHVSHFVQKANQGYILRLEITQKQEPFVFPLWVGWKEDGQKVRKMVIVDERNEVFEIELTGKPRKIKINPDKAVPGKFHE